MWIGLLFCILSLSVQFWKLSNKSLSGILSDQALRDPQDAINNYREKTVQCLVLGNYTEPGPYTVETLLLYYVSDHFRSSDAQFGTWMVFSLVVRAAMRLGYHRDASHFPKISVFRGEIQRRLWHMIVHLDLINSLQVGLPRMIRDNSFDTQEPRNLLDEDFDEQSTQLPPSRPNDELTSIVYSNAKHHITDVFGMIVDQSNSINPISYEEVMRLDKLLHERQACLPELLKAMTIEDLNSGVPQDRIRKFSIDLTFQKARCVLHRKWFFPKKFTAIYPYPYSMKACLDASMRIIQTQIVINDETGPGKALHDHKWKTSSLITHDFLLAAMLLCLYLGYSIDAENTEQANLQAQTGIRVQWERDDILRNLQRTYAIWEEMSSASKDAKKVAKALKSMLSRVRNPAAPRGKDIHQEAFKLAYTAGGPSSGKSVSWSNIDLVLILYHSNVHASSAATADWSEFSKYGDPVANPPNSKSTKPGRVKSSTIPPEHGQHGHNGARLGEKSLDAPFSLLSSVLTRLLQELWDKTFFTTSLADGDTPPELWNFDANFTFPEPNANYMQWDQQI
jgi:Fungal specific transcription factor domain